MIGFETSVQQRLVLTRPPESPLRTQVRTVLASRPGSDELAAALLAVVDRHDVLRTTFVRQPGRHAPLQQVAESLAVPLRTNGDAEADEVAANEWQAPLDTASGPVMRAALVRDEGRPDVLILTAASAVADRDSLALVASEIDATLGGVGTVADPIQYAQYTAWQADLTLGGGEQTEGEQAAFWVGDGPLPASTLPASSVREPAGSQPPCAVMIDLDAATTAWLASLTSEGVDPCDVWLAALAVVAGRQNGEAKVGIGLDDPSRGDELEGAIGPYRRLLPVSVDVEKAGSLLQLAADLARRRSSASEAAEFAPDFLAAAGPRPPHLRFEVRPLAQWESVQDSPEPFRLQLVVAEASLGSKAKLLVDASVTRDHAEAIGRSLSAVLASSAGKPDAQCRDLSSLHDTDRRILLGAQQSGSGSPVTNRAVPQRIADACRAYPDLPAVSCGDAALSYGELDQRLEQIADAVRARQLDLALPVGVLMSRGIDQLVSMLAIGRAGAPYLCLEIDQPSARTAEQIDDAGCQLVLTGAGGMISLPPLEVEFLSLEDAATASPPSEPSAVESPALTAPRREVATSARPEDIAYLVYTSGSTGRPKGVAVTHGGLTNYALALSSTMARLAGREPTDLTYGAVSSLSTDLANTAVYPALISGGHVDLVPEDVALDPVRFADYVERHCIDVLKITPSHLEMLLSTAGTLPRRLLVVGGEASGWGLLDQVTERGACRVLNHYGPTETTVGSLTYDVAAGDGAHRQRPGVPIGRPVDNTTAYVVDEHLDLLAPGEVGELVIGGAGLARGYWRDDVQTAARFVTDPFARSHGGRLYRTGDRVRQLPDGAFEFLGRLDGQVKLRGYRIETTEIEVELRRHTQVQRAAVVLRRDERGPALVGYVVSDYQVPPSASALRDFLRGRLPDHMIPTAIVFLDTLPLRPNGKLDEARLPPPEEQALDGHRDYVAPTTDTERAVVEIFEDLLGVERVGIDDNFFELGGHSLLATQAIARLRNALGVHLQVHVIFSEPTPARLAAAVDVEATLEAPPDADVALLLEELEQLSDEEAEALLASMGDDAEQ